MLNAIKQIIKIENNKLKFNKNYYIIQNINTVSSLFSEAENQDNLQIKKIIKDTFLTTRSKFIFIYFLIN